LCEGGDFAEDLARLEYFYPYDLSILPKFEIDVWCQLYETLFQTPGDDYVETIAFPVIKRPRKLLSQLSSTFLP